MSYSRRFQGYAKPNKTVRRFLGHRIAEMIDEGLIEKVSVPGKRENTRHLCLRLLPQASTSAIVEEEPVEVTEVPQGIDLTINPKMHPSIDASIPKQLVTLLERAGERGMTMRVS